MNITEEDLRYLLVDYILLDINQNIISKDTFGSLNEGKGILDTIDTNYKIKYFKENTVYNVKLNLTEQILLHHPSYNKGNEGKIRFIEKKRSYEKIIYVKNCKKSLSLR